MANIQPKQPAQAPALTLWDRAAQQVRTYAAPDQAIASLESWADLIDQQVCFVKVVRESQSAEYGKSALFALVVKDEPDTQHTIWSNENTVLYKQVMDELKNGPFIAEIRQYLSKKSGNSYYTLAVPGSDRFDEQGNPMNSDESVNDLPF